jgi:C_GCAxxG_C_C family probable redox protein
MKKPYSISKAHEKDMPEIISLLQQCSLPAEDLYDDKQIFWTAKSEDRIVGTASIENYHPDGLFRSFAVHPSYRKQGIGAALLDHVMKESEKRGIESLYLCTDTAALYFEKHKWLYVTRDAVDEKVRQSQEFRSPWSAGTACMYFPVKEGHVKTAVQYYQSGFNCAQSVFSSFAPVMGVGTKEALKITSGFGAGICYKGEVCGAVSGAYMAIGLKYGRWKSEDAAAKENTYALMKEFDRRFIARNGSLYCNQLLEGDMSTPEGRMKINDERKFKTHCPRFVKDAAEIAGKLMEQD